MKSVWARQTPIGDIRLYSTREKAVWRGATVNVGYYDIQQHVNRDGETVTELWRKGVFAASIMEMKVR